MSLGKDAIFEFLDRFIGLETDSDSRNGMIELYDAVRPIIEKLVKERDEYKTRNEGAFFAYLGEIESLKAQILEAQTDRDEWKICARMRLNQIVKLEQEKEAMEECVAILRYFVSDVQSNGVVSYQWNNAKREVLAKLDALKGGQG